MGAVTTARTETRDRILDAAVRTLAEHGYAGTTARSIATIGGFAPGVIYYHFADLDELFIAVATYSSTIRSVRYRAELIGETSAVELVQRLRRLYAEDLASGHVEAVQELLSAARPGSALAATMSEQTREWESIAEQVLGGMLRGTALARLFRVPVAARAAVAYYMGMQTLTHLDGDTSRPEAAFAQAAKLAATFDRLPKIRRRTTRPS
jgi:AcrR family transcriptional regulator